ncbi:MAG: TonB family protein [Burkholderiales bacterium]|jgi:protein TonB|nr:TonB family protein [Burkholderiales bacterium]
MKTSPRIAAAAIALALAGCMSQADRPPTQAEPRVGQPETAAAPPSQPKADAAVPAPKPKTPLDLYKEDVARHVAARNATRVYTDAPPHFLRSIVVVQVTVDKQGSVTRLRTLRSNGYADLEQAAHRSVKTAAPLPVPPAGLVRAGTFEFAETWLFRDDGRFQLRSLSDGVQGEPQNGWDRTRR